MEEQAKLMAKKVGNKPKKHALIKSDSVNLKMPFNPIEGALRLRNLRDGETEKGGPREAAQRGKREMQEGS